MTIPAQTTTETAGANPTVGNGTAPAGGATPPAVPSTPVTTPKTEKTEAKTEKIEAPAKPKEKKVATLADDDEDLPEDAELYQLSKKALESRLNRHTKRQLRERFGTDDIDFIAKEMKELKLLRGEKEEQRKAQLSKEERLEEERQSAVKRAEEAEQKAQALEDKQDVSEVSDRYIKLGVKFINPKFLDKPAHRAALFGELADHLHKVTAGDATKVTPSMVESFWRDYVKENPEFSLKREEVVEVPITTGTRQPGPNGVTPPAGNGNANTGKTTRPNQPNSMTKAEIKKHTGHTW